MAARWLPGDNRRIGDMDGLGAHGKGLGWARCNPRGALRGLAVMGSPPGGGWLPVPSRCCWQTLKRDFQPKGQADRLPIPVCRSPRASPKSAVSCRNLRLQTAAETLVCAGMLRVPGYGVSSGAANSPKRFCQQILYFFMLQGLRWCPASFF